MALVKHLACVAGTFTHCWSFYPVTEFSCQIELHEHVQADLYTTSRPARTQMYFLHETLHSNCASLNTSQDGLAAKLG